ncbi:MAG: BON domain-containing protein [Rhizobium sp.]
MKTLVTRKLVGISLLCVAALAGCDKPGPAENVGKKIDQSADRAGQKIGNAVDKVEITMAEQSEKAGVALDDAAITSKVKAAIFAEPGLRTLQISVDTVKGVVTLSGSVGSPADSDRAKSLATAVAGVKEVNNRLVPLPIK